MCIYDRLKELGLELPEAPQSAGIYFRTREFGTNMLYTSGIGPMKDGVPVIKGKVGGDVSLEQGREAARYTMLNLLAVVQEAVGDLNRIKRFVKVLGFVACTQEFYEQPQVMNAASQLLIDIFGEERGKAARSAVGTNALPGNIPVEIEALIEMC